MGRNASLVFGAVPCEGFRPRDSRLGLGNDFRSNDASGPDRLDFPAEGLPVERFRWRCGERPKLNFLWVLGYITKAPPEHVSPIWFDHIAVSRQYIGSLKQSAGK